MCLPEVVFDYTPSHLGVVDAPDAPAKHRERVEPVYRTSDAGRAVMPRDQPVSDTLPTDGPLPNCQTRLALHKHQSGQPLPRHHLRLPNDEALVVFPTDTTESLEATLDLSHRLP